MRETIYYNLQEIVTWGWCETNPQGHGYQTLWGDNQFGDSKIDDNNDNDDIDDEGFQDQHGDKTHKPW